MAVLTLFLHRQQRWWLRWGCVMWALAVLVPSALAQEPPMAASERQLKVAFIYNFMRFTEWPDEVGNALTLCVRGADPFGAVLDTLEGRAVGTRTLTVQRRGGDSLKGCQAVFISAAAQSTQAQVLAELRGKPVLTIADSPGAARQGVNLNMAVARSKVTFEANLQTARAAQLKLSSQLLRLATEVIQ